MRQTTALQSWFSRLGCIGLALAGLLAGRAEAQTVVRLDYAYYNPLSLVLKQKHWVEDAEGSAKTIGKL